MCRSRRTEKTTARTRAPWAALRWPHASSVDNHVRVEANTEGDGTDASVRKAVELVARDSDEARSTQLRQAVERKADGGARGQRVARGGAHGSQPRRSSHPATTARGGAREHRMSESVACGGARGQRMAYGGACSPQPQRSSQPSTVASGGARGLRARWSLHPVTTADGRAHGQCTATSRARGPRLRRATEFADVCSG